MVGMLVLSEKAAPPNVTGEAGYIVDLREITGLVLEGPEVQPTPGTVIDGRIALKSRGMFVTDREGVQTMKVLIGAINKVMRDNQLLFNEIAEGLGVSGQVDVDKGGRGRFRM